MHVGYYKFASIIFGFSTNIDIGDRRTFLVRRLFFTNSFLFAMLSVHSVKPEYMEEYLKQL